MVRKGAPRLCTLLFWNLGWLLMVRAFFKVVRTHAERVAGSGGDVPAAAARGC